jgi:hypothetical protein
MAMSRGIGSSLECCRFSLLLNPEGGRWGLKLRVPKAAGFIRSRSADFFSVVVSIDTMNRRPLINTVTTACGRDRYRRFHVILGDSAERWATAMKIGYSADVDLIECGKLESLNRATG